jgi:hypothetical protein
MRNVAVEVIFRYYYKLANYCAAEASYRRIFLHSILSAESVVWLEQCVLQLPSNSLTDYRYAKQVLQLTLGSNLGWEPTVVFDVNFGYHY